LVEIFEEKGVSAFVRFEVKRVDCELVQTLDTFVNYQVDLTGAGLVLGDYETFWPKKTKNFEIGNRLFFSSDNFTRFLGDCGYPARRFGRQT
jgi:hypothetical protein